MPTGACRARDTYDSMPSVMAVSFSPGIGLDTGKYDQPAYSSSFQIFQFLFAAERAGVTTEVSSKSECFEFKNGKIPFCRIKWRAHPSGKTRTFEDIQAAAYLLSIINNRTARAWSWRSRLTCRSWCPGGCCSYRSEECRYHRDGSRSRSSPAPHSRLSPLA